MNMKKNAAGHTDRHHPWHHRWQVPPPAGRGAAAEAGSRAARERARTASRAWSQRENDVASSLQSCLSLHQGRQHHSSAVPPARTNSSATRKTRVCDAVVDRVNEHLPGNIDPLERL